MASTLSAFSLCVLLCAVTVLSKPTKELGPLKPVPSTDNLLKRVLKSETVLSENFRASERVLSFDSAVLSTLPNPNQSLRRNKRQVITGPGCPGGMIWFMRRCMSYEAYERLVKLEEAD
ncbi:hypothetical protein PYW08_004677 [Mythimna loreyi]|uniref:Uncharacterized protein n=1 Tax=Mythimna loreyi TaxID=667449 RepID=A0ACC2QS56_9NEOP|nr:hypothetical protein PYW08_004677 [Mythimna loreyi]